MSAAPERRPGGGVLLLSGADQVVPCTTVDPDGVLTGAAVAIAGGRISEVGEAGDLRRRFPDATETTLAGGVLTPGLVDSHTHAVFGRTRADEYALRASGVPYMEVARRGGGINASVRDLRSRSEDELVDIALPRLRECFSYGTTTIEIKSGYGLDTRSELRTLAAIDRIAGAVPQRVVATFLAHEVPPEHASDRGRYVDLLVEEMIPAAAEQGVARFCDVFCEPGVFDTEQARRILLRGQELGLEAKLHADELENGGGAELAAELGAASADHLGAISPAGVEALAAAASADEPTVATLLPATLLFLGRGAYAPARALLDAGATVALATDFNPGSSPTPGLPIVLTLACSQMHMSPLEALVAATSGGAAALRLDDGIGTLAEGAPADLVWWRVPDYREIPYHVGVNRVGRVWVGGEVVVDRSDGRAATSAVTASIRSR
ncbi:MAG TPA: imidazolonepropionase [Longimicrobiales bacterium]|nr:imidazolonepropionase [Longimicrobiales bacterium]